MNKVTKFLKRNSATILKVVGLSGMATSIVLAVKATPKALELRERSVMEQPDQTPKEMAKNELKIYVKVYWPTAMAFLLSAGCIALGDYIRVKNTMAVMAMYELSETALKTLQQKTIERLGETDGQQLIADSYQKQIIDKLPDPEHRVLMQGPGGGSVLFVDSLSNMVFKSDKEVVNRILNEFNADLNNYNTMALNEWYDAMNLPHTELGNQIQIEAYEKKDLMRIDFVAGETAWGELAYILVYDAKFVF